MMHWWCAGDALMIHWLYTDNALRMHWWYADNVLMMHWWCNGLLEAESCKNMVLSVPANYMMQLQQADVAKKGCKSKNMLSWYSLATGMILETVWIIHTLRLLIVIYCGSGMGWSWIIKTISFDQLWSTLISFDQLWSLIIVILSEFWGWWCPREGMKADGANHISSFHSRPSRFCSFSTSSSSLKNCGPSKVYFPKLCILTSFFFKLCFLKCIF